MIAVITGHFASVSPPKPCMRLSPLPQKSKVVHLQAMKAHRPLDLLSGQRHASAAFTQAKNSGTHRTGG